MNKTKITVITVGHMPAEFDKKKIQSWKSDVFSIEGKIENYSITADSDGGNWDFTDSKLPDFLPKTYKGDFLIALVNVPLEQNWYTRRLDGNKIVFTFHEIKNILDYLNIPLENVIFRLLYAFTLLYKRSGENIPDSDYITNFSHDETRGCIHDMNGHKNDVIYSCHQPVICSDCIERLRREQVSNEMIEMVIKELKKIKKPLFFRITDWIKKHPIWAIAFSSILAIILGGIGSLLATTIYDIVNNVK